MVTTAITSRGCPHLPLLFDLQEQYRIRDIDRHPR